MSKLTKWFSQFTIEASVPEYKFMQNYMNTGTMCMRYEDCEFTHHLAALVCNGKNNHILRDINDLDRKELPVRLSSEGWVHMTNLADQWHKDFEEWQKKRRRNAKS